jgi:hypothetical protein
VYRHHNPEKSMSRLILALAGSAALAIAAVVVYPPSALAATPSGTSAATTAQAVTDPATGLRSHRKGRGERLAALKNSPVFQTMRNLRQLERLYLIDGRAQDIPALYREVLAKTENPAVRQFAYNRIAHNELKPGEVDQAISTLRRSLDESLQRLPPQ